ncbi:ATP-binding protein [Aquimarina litoralis]|uniref:histidine kinase n=1 Tax=Aquimarina litoralis TaxID=584605 RepID=A0ABP3TPG4_9FLAO
MINFIFLINSKAQTLINDTSSLADKEYTAQDIDSVTAALRKSFYKGEFHKIIDFGTPLLDYVEKTNFFREERGLRSLITNTFIQLDEFEGAEDLINEGLERAKLKKDTLATISGYIDLSNCYFENEPLKAIIYLKPAAPLVQKVQHPRAQFIVNSNLAELYERVDTLEVAQKHLDISWKLLDMHSSADWRTEFEAVTLHIQGAIFLKQKKYERAIETIKKSLELGYGKFDQRYHIKNYENLMMAYENIEQYKNVTEIRHIYDSLITARYKSEKIKQQNIASSKFKLDQYKQKLLQSQLENEISLQKQAKSDLLLKIFYASSVILIAILGFLFYTRYKRNLLLENLKLKNQQYLEAKEESEKLANKNTQFLSTISHELRTPLYGIVGLSSVFLKDPKFDEHSDDLSSLKFSADYLLSLVNDVLNLNKFSSAEGRQIHKSNFKIRQLISNIAQNFEFLNRKNNNSINITVSEKVPEILYTDKMKISQVLLNLISNACKFTEDGKIEVRVEFLDYKNEQYLLKFMIKDTGKGIPEEEQTNIFNEFAQVQNNQDLGGTGLGLAIVNKILLTLNSKLNLKSTLHKGSEFFFDVWLEAGNHITAEKEELLGFEKLKNKHILIVDDNKINQVVTRKILEQYDMKHQIASNGLEAISFVEEDSFDAILMDINMPIMDGMESSTQIRTFNKTVPIIALTATDYVNENRNLKDYGINDFIIKPYKTEDLLETLTKHITNGKV